MESSKEGLAAKPPHKMGQQTPTSFYTSTGYYCNCTCFGVKCITPSESYLFSAVWRWVVYNSEFFGDRLRGPKPMPTFSSASCRSGPHRHGPKTRTQSDFETKKCTVNCGKNQMMFSGNICFFPGFLRKTKHLTLTQLLKGENMLNMLRMPWSSSHLTVPPSW